VGGVLLTSHSLAVHKNAALCYYSYTSTKCQQDPSNNTTEDKIVLL